MANLKSCLSTDAFATQLKNRLLRYVKPGQRLCVALSGGVDSIVLLHATGILAKTLQIKPLVAMHIHHGLSPNAAGWEDFCRQRCNELGVDFESCRVEVNPQGEGLEAAARNARYAALAASDCDWMLLGHHRDDQAETVLLNLLRGAGVHGAAAMPEARGKLLRPLLGFSREQIIAYAEQSNLCWIEDESNTDSRYSRNFLRCEVMPLLEEKFPQAGASLARAAHAFADSAEMLHQLASDDLGAAKLLHVDQLRSLNSLRAGNLLAFYLRQHGLQIPSSTTLNEMLRQLLSAERDSEICFRIVDREVRCFRSQVLVDAVSTTVTTPMVWNGEPELVWGDYRIHSHLVIGDGIDASVLNQNTLKFSTRQGGGVMQLRQNGPHRPLKDLLREAAIPPWRRDRLPVLYANDEVVWVAGVGIAAKYCCKPAEQGILIEFDGVTW